MTVEFPGASFLINDVAVQPDGKVVLTGVKGGSMAVARLNVDGTPDVTFGPDGTGLVQTKIGYGNHDGSAVAIHDDGKIVVVGRVLTAITALPQPIPGTARSSSWPSRRVV